MFDVFKWQGVDLGYYIEKKDFLIFFGNINFTKEHFSRVFPQLNFFSIQQVHGDNIVEAQPELCQADAHYTEDLSSALVIQTADCVPVMLAGDGMIAACHAGWRGLAANIVTRTAQKVQSVKAAFIGPHIGPQSFAVGPEVAVQFGDPKKRFLDLAHLTELQLRAGAGDKFAIEQAAIDTMTDARFHSYRRDHAKAGRQYSFVARLR